MDFDKIIQKAKEFINPNILKKVAIPVIVAGATLVGCQMNTQEVSVNLQEPTKNIQQVNNFKLQNIDVALQGNRISLNFSENIKNKNLDIKNFQLKTISNQQNLELDKVEIENNQIILFPKNRIMAQDGNNFTISYNGDIVSVKNNSLSEKIENKAFKNTSISRPLHLNELNPAVFNQFHNDKFLSKMFYEKNFNVLNYINLQRDNTVYYTVDKNYAQKYLSNQIDKLKQFQTNDENLIENVTDEQIKNIDEAMKIVSKATGINFVKTDDISKANLGFINSVYKKNAEAFFTSNIEVDGKNIEDLKKINKNEKFNNINYRGIVSFNTLNNIKVDNSKNSQINNFQELKKGTDEFSTILHEVGHFLGLADTEFTLIKNKINRDKSVMSYTTGQGQNYDKNYYNSYKEYDLKSFKYLYGNDGLNNKEGLSIENSPIFKKMDSYVEYQNYLKNNKNENLNDIQKRADVQNNFLNKIVNKFDFNFNSKEFNLNKDINNLLKDVKEVKNLKNNNLKEYHDYKIEYFKLLPFCKETSKNDISKNTNLNSKIRVLTHELISQNIDVNKITDYLDKINENNIDKFYQGVLERKLKIKTQINNNEINNINNLLNSDLTQDKLFNALYLSIDNDKNSKLIKNISSYINNQNLNEKYNVFYKNKLENLNISLEIYDDLTNEKLETTKILSNIEDKFILKANNLFDKELEQEFKKLNQKYSSQIQQINQNSYSQTEQTLKSYIKEQHKENFKNYFENNSKTGTIMEVGKNLVKNKFNDLKISINNLWDNISNYFNKNQKNIAKNLNDIEYENLNQNKFVSNSNLNNLTTFNRLTFDNNQLNANLLNASNNNYAIKEIQNNIQTKFNINENKIKNDKNNSLNF